MVARLDLGSVTQVRVGRQCWNLVPIEMRSSVFAIGPSLEYYLSTRQYAQSCSMEGVYALTDLQSDTMVPQKALTGHVVHSCSDDMERVHYLVNCMLGNAVRNSGNSRWQT